MTPMPHPTRPSPFSPTDLQVPLIQAPMAGGISTPSLAVAIGQAGGLGFLAAGYLSPDAVAAQIAEVRKSVDLFGVNLFVPQPVAEPDRVPAYRRELEETEAERYAVTLPDTDHWQAKLTLLLNDPVPVVSFTFGLPDAETVAHFKDQGTYTVGTVTSVDEAHQAVNVGIDALCVQGPEAGGHRGTFNPAALRSPRPSPRRLPRPQPTNPPPTRRSRQPGRPARHRHVRRHQPPSSPGRPRRRDPRNASRRCRRPQLTSPK